MPVTLIQLTCDGCGQPFKKLLSQTRRSKRHFCRRDCYLSTVDHRALGSAGGRIKGKRYTAEQKFNRSSRGGVARAAKLSPERLHEIAMLAVAARGRKAIKRQTVSRLVGTKSIFGVKVGKALESKIIEGEDS